MSAEVTLTSKTTNRDTVPYSIAVSGQPDNLCEAWTDSRLQYQKKVKWQVDFRRELAAKLAGVRYSPSQILHGIYGAEATQKGNPPDTENVLFYNVGPGAFKHLAGRGVRFERVFARPCHMMHSTGADAHHYHRYGPADRDMGYSIWKPANIIARWNSMDCGTSKLSATTVWYAAKNSVIKTATAPSASPLSRFGLTVSIEAGPRSLRNSAELVKCIFDGVISAFHSQAGVPRVEVSEWLASELGETSQRMAGLLANSDLAFLGAKNLVRGRAPRFLWAPDDHNCVAGELLTLPLSNSDSWKLSGAIYEVEPVATSNVLSTRR